MTEWEQVVDAWQLQSWEAYRDVLRLGRKTRLPESQRVVLWSIFERVRSRMRSRGLITYAEMFSQLASQFQEGKRSPFDFVVVDEAQDISVAQLRFLAALGGWAAERPVLCRRPGPADLSAALFVEGAGRRHSRPLPDAADQLPHLSPDQNAGRSAAGARIVGC